MFPSGAPALTPGFSGVHVTRSFVFCVVFCRSLFVLLAIVFSDFLQVKDSDYHFWYLQTLLEVITCKVLRSPLNHG